MLASAAAQRAATVRRFVGPFLVALAVVVTGALSPAAAAAAGPKVVIVVGPTHSATASYLDRARDYAAEARRLGANVVEVYTPRATWTNVRNAAQGAKVLIYLGHGNGWPSPYTANPATKNGFGLNPPTGAGTSSPVKYYGGPTIAAEIDLAPGATVLLNHLCYASGNGEPGMAEPSWSVARQRVDNYASGFLGAGAGAVLADGHTSLVRELRVLLGKDQNLLAAWRADADANGHERSFASVQRPGFTNYIDPDNASSRFYRALTTKPGFTTSGGGSSAGSAPVAPTTSLKATTGADLILRSRPSTSASRILTLRNGTTVSVIGQFRNDGAGRTWAPVRTSSGKSGWVAAWYVRVTGSAVATTNVVLRGTARVQGTNLGTVRAGTRVKVTGSMKDANLGVWLKVEVPGGKTGWMAAWLMRP